MKARDLMTPNPAVVTGEDRITRAAELMRDRDVGLIPVVDDLGHMHVAGVISDRDIAVRCVADAHDSGCLVREHMTRGELDTVTPDADSEDVIKLMERDQVRRVLVVDERHRLQGIIAQADLARRMGPSEPLKVEEVVEAISMPAPVRATT
ncbi:MAG TPA: CBS domain-containing protein [Gemmatimonadaceae bacterium]|nr:CBS domain-containing protein [Gemmatimonadaceae bacterium]